MVRWSITGSLEQLAMDCCRYGLDIVGLQETKSRNYENLVYPNNYRVIIFDQIGECHGGVGFVVSVSVLMLL